MSISATQLRIGMVILYQDELYRITGLHHLTPGNKRGQVQVKMKRIKDDVSFENRFRSDDTVERAVLDQHDMQYLYEQNGLYYFMDNETYEQITLTEETLGDSIKFMLPDTVVKVEMYEGKPMGIELPKSVDLKVVSTEAQMKRATAQASYKPAELETGVTVSVPPFIKDGDIVRIDTQTGQYLERVNK